MTISRRSNAPPSRTGAVCHWENQRAYIRPGKTQLIGCPKDEVLLRSYLKCVVRVNGSDSAGILGWMSMWDGFSNRRAGRVENPSHIQCVIGGSAGSVS